MRSLLTIGLGTPGKTSFRFNRRLRGLQNGAFVVKPHSTLCARKVSMTKGHRLSSVGRDLENAPCMIRGGFAIEKRERFTL